MAAKEPTPPAETPEPLAFPAPPAERIGEAEMAEYREVAAALAARQKDVQTAVDAERRAQGAYEYVTARIARTYSLQGDDKIQSDGTIVRATPQAPAE